MDAAQRLERRGLLLALAGGLLGACGTPPQPTHFDSQLSFNRTFENALAAMASQKMIFSEQDLRRGRIVGELKGDVIEAQLQPMFDGTIRVSFSARGTPADPALLQRVAATYAERATQQSRLLPGGSL
jgi:hypothetical protein